MSPSASIAWRAAFPHGSNDIQNLRKSVCVGKSAHRRPEELVALHVNLDKTAELTKETSPAQAASVKRC